MKKTKSGFKKVSEIQSHIEHKLYELNRLEEFQSESFDFKTTNFTVKRAEAYLKALSGRGQLYLYTVAEIATSISKIDSELLLIDVDVQPTHEWSSSKKLTDEQFALVLSTLCSYWVEYGKFKGVKSVLFDWTHSRHKPVIDKEIFELAMENLNFKRVENASEVISKGGWKNDNLRLFRSCEEHEKLDIAEFLQKEVEKAKLTFPSFTVEKFGSQTIAIFDTLYYFENEKFSMNWEKENDQDVVILKRDERENQTFILKEGVVEEILLSIREEMKLSNLLKPPIKHMKHFCKEHLKFEPEDSLFEDKIRFIDEYIGNGETENEIFKINHILSQVEPKYDKGQIVQTRMSFFTLNTEEKKYFIERYGFEFEFYHFQTDKFFWHVMYSKNEKDIWLYPEFLEGIPEKMKQDAESIFENRRNEELVQKVQDVLEILESMKKFDIKSNSYTVSSTIDSFKRIGREEFGKIWWNEKRSNK